MGDSVQSPNRIFGKLRRVTIGALVSAITIAIMPTSSAQAQIFTSLYAFAGEPDGGNPSAPLVRDAKGNLYGTTVNGGNAGCFVGAGCGTVFKADVNGKETVLYSFTGGADGANPTGGLVRVHGDLYGTTSAGGTYGSGTVFKLDRNRTETVVHSFTGGADGGSPGVALARDKQGNLYGTTYYGGGDFSCSAGCGTVFQVDTNGNESVLYSFAGTGGDGHSPFAALIRDKLGNLYGDTQWGGAYDSGTVFKVDPNGHETVLYSFTGTGGDGKSPSGRLVRDVKGNLYGTTEFGGVFGNGTVYKLDINGKETVLYSFTGGADGAVPLGGLVRAHSKIYGTTSRGGDLGCSGGGCGIVFMLDNTGQETVLHTFTLNDGGYSAAGILRDNLGNLYGTTVGGGNTGCQEGLNGCGTVFNAIWGNRCVGTKGEE